MKKLLFLFFIYSQTFSQTVILKGKLVDKETSKPIVYANISFLKTNKGTSSLEDGTFNLEIDKNLLSKKVHISCLNYKDTIVLAKELQNTTFFLQSKNYELEEVVISKKVDRELIVDKYKRRHIKSGFSGIKGAPWIVSKYFKYKDEYKNTPYVKEVTVYFGSMLLRKKSKFRIRLFKANKKTKEPTDDLISEEIIVSSRKIDGKIKINVAKYNIKFPKEGFFVGLERLHIPYNFHKETYTIQGDKKKYKDIRVSPTFGATYTKDTMWVFSQGKWRKHYFPQEFYKGNAIQPAISLTLTN